jgi:hypothetical protein
MAITFERVDKPDWVELDSYPDRTVFQTKPWLDFIVEAQGAVPVVLRIFNEGELIGYFTGLIIRKYGFNILGSPFPGWTTSYMGFNLKDNTFREVVVKALFQYAFSELKCIHVEMMDRRLTFDLVVDLGVEYRHFSNFEIDLSQSEDELFNSMKGSVRTSIRKAEKSGVVVEAVSDIVFADEYYFQLKDVFTKQSLSPTYGVNRVRSLIKHMLPTGNLLLVRARTDSGDCAATAIYPAYNGTMYFWGGASLRKYQILQPNEAVHWFAMQYWKNRGMTKCDMGGGGEYKRKYGGYEIDVPWFRQSRNQFFAQFRQLAQKGQGIKQRIKGRLKFS